MELIVGGEKQGNVLRRVQRSELRQSHRARAEFRCVTRSEFIEARGIMAEPATQLGARRDLLEPKINDSIAFF